VGCGPVGLLSMGCGPLLKEIVFNFFGVWVVICVVSMGIGSA